MFKDYTKLYNLVDLRSVIILVRKIQSFYIEVRTEFWKEELKSKNPIHVNAAKEDIDRYWRSNMKDIFEGLSKSGYLISFEGNKINISLK